MNWCVLLQILSLLAFCALGVWVVALITQARSLRRRIEALHRDIVERQQWKP